MDMNETQDGLKSAADVMHDARKDLSAGSKLVAAEVLRRLANDPNKVPASLAGKALELAETSDTDLEAAVATASATRSPAAPKPNPTLGVVDDVAFERIEMVNFRSFLGEQTLELSADPARPLTLVFGPNGAGKTTLLNAFTWCLFNSFTEGFTTSSGLRSKEAKEDAEVSVTVHARHNNKTVVVKRTLGAAGPSILIEGKTATIGDLEEIFPEALKDMFFFPGETFSKPKILQSQSSADRAEPLLPIRKSIISLLNGERFKTCADLLITALQQDALKVPKGSDKALEQAEEEKAQAQARVFSLKKLASDLPAEVELLRIKAEGAEALANQVDREAVQSHKNEEARLQKVSEKAEELVAQLDGYCTRLFKTAPAVLVGPSSSAAVQNLDRAEALGILPPLIDPRILQRCLDDDHCRICDEPFGAGVGDPAITHERFTKLLGKAEIGINSRVSMSARESLIRFSDDAAHHLSELRAEAQSIAKTLSEDYDLSSIGSVADDADLEHLVAFARNTVDSLSSVARDAQKALENHGETSPDTQDASTKLNLWHNAKNKHDQQAAALEELPGLTTAAEALFRKADELYQKLAEGNAGNAAKARAQKYLTEALGYYETAQKALSSGVRVDVERQINVIYSSAVRKSYLVNVDDNFQMQVVHEDSGEPADISQSETVLLLLCFIATISRLAPRWQRLGSANVNPHDVVGTLDPEERGGLPVCLDAPLSPLDDDYEDLVIENLLPTLSRQTVLFVSKKSAPKWTKLISQIGQTYVMRLSASNENHQHLDWLGSPHEYTVHDEVTECRTELKKI